MGSSVGTSIVTTLVARRSQFHQEILVNHIRAGNFNLQNAAIGLARRLTSFGLSAADARKQAYARIYQLVQMQAGSLAYVDTFMVLAVGSAIMFVLAFILKENSTSSGRDLLVE